MLVKELIEILQGMPQDAEVIAGDDDDCDDTHRNRGYVPIRTGMMYSNDDVKLGIRRISWNTEITVLPMEDSERRAIILVTREVHSEVDNA